MEKHQNPEQEQELVSDKIVKGSTGPSLMLWVFAILVGLSVLWLVVRYFLVKA